MKIFQDIFSEAEIISDSYKMQMTYDDVIGEVKSRLVIKKEGEVDIGCGNAFGGGEQQEQGPGGAPVEKVIDVVDAFQYQETSFDIDNFKTYFREYMKKLLTHLQAKNEGRVAGFKAGALAFFKWAQANFGELTFYTPSNYDTENLIVMSYYKNEQDEAPTFLYVMDGLKFYKV